MDIKELYARYCQFPSVNTDTRKLKEGDIFFALKGGNFNGNLYAARALKLGASFVVVDETTETPAEQTLLVNDVLETLQELANYHRNQLDLTVIAATGSNGKTTSKELIHRVLSKKFKCYSTPGNFNNHIGLPLSLLQIKPDCQIAILEMGDNKQGDVTELCHIAQPDYGFITNIGKDHIEGFGSMENNIKAKKEIFDYLKSNSGKIFLNEADELVTELASTIDSPITFGKEGSYAHIRYESANPYIAFLSEEQTLVETQLIGKYNFENIQLAHCIGKHFGVNDQETSNAIKEYIPDNNRSEINKTDKNTLIMDAYNANPSSVEKALESFSEMETDMTKWVILGDMLELGTISKNEHNTIINSLKLLNFKNVLLIGDSYHSANTSNDYNSFPNKTEAEQFLTAQPIQNSIILLKGSRGIKLETLKELL